MTTLARSFLWAMLAPVLVVLVLALAALPTGAGAQSVLQQLVEPPAEEGTAGPGEAEPGALTPEQTRLIADLLRDEAAREALIAELERLAAERAGTAEAAPGAETAPGAGPARAGEELSFGRQIAQQTQEIAQGLAGRAEAFWRQLAGAPEVFAGLSRLDTDFLLAAAWDLAAVIVTTVALFVILRHFAKRLYRAMGARSRGMGFMGTAAVYLASVAVDALVVVLAWAAGYALALTLLNDFGQIGIRQALYLNAFLVVEMVKVGIRALLSPAAGELRPVHITDLGARLTYRTLNIAVSVIGYGQFLVVPVVVQNVGYFAGRSVSALLLLVALLVMATAVVRRRRAVAAWLVDDQDEAAPRNGIWRALARLWYVPVLLYLAGVFVIVVTRPGDVLLPVLGASARILIAAAIGWGVAGLLGRAMRRGVRLPVGVNRRLPLLQRRLNAFVPRVLFVIRIVILIAVIAYTANSMRLLDVGGWLDGPVGAWVTTTAVSAALILIVSFAAWLALTSWVDYRLNPDFGTVPSARESTLLTLLRNAVTIALVVITLMFVLSELGIDIAPLIASAGVIGLAIGFGAQKLVQDIITGIFIQLENAINVGDVVTAGGTSGVVERLTIRSVSLRDLNGVYHIIPFSSVDMVSNFMREFAFVVADIGVAYRVNVEDARQAMFDAFEELRADPDQGASILDDLEWFGVDQLADSAVVLRARIKTLPGKQWGVGRAYNGVIKRVFDERGIEIPFPHRTLYLGEGTQGVARVSVGTGAPAPESDAAITGNEESGGQGRPEGGA